MDELEEWIEEKLADITERLPSQAHDSHASFAWGWGFNIGYKQAMLDLSVFLDSRKEEG